MDSRFDDICVLRLLEYRSLLAAARAGYPGHTSPVSASYYESMVSKWESIKQARSPEALPSDLRHLYDIACQASATAGGRS